MVPTRRKLKVATDYYEVQLPKCDSVCEFHSPWELLNAALRVGERNVVAFEPQPEKIRSANGKIYTPDYLCQTIHEKTYGEIKSAKGLETAKPQLEPLLQDFSAKRGAKYRFDSHEEIAQRGVEAWAMLKVTRWDLQFRDVDLSEVKRNLLKLIGRRSDWDLHELIGQLSEHPPDHVIATVCQQAMQGLVLLDLTKGFSRHTKVMAA